MKPFSLVLAFSFALVACGSGMEGQSLPSTTTETGTNIDDSLDIDRTNRIFGITVETTSQSATISWSTSFSSDSSVEYGLTTAYGSTSELDSNRVSQHQITLVNLEPDTVYHYRVISQGAKTRRVATTDRIFRTAPEVVPEPVPAPTPTPAPPPTPTPVPPPTPGAGIIFQSGWENSTDLGCTYDGLIDGQTSSSRWSDYGPNITCNTPSIAQITTAEKHDGNRSLQVNFLPDGSGNGPDFRIDRSFTGRSEIYARWWVKYSSNWVWGGGDHKVAIFGGSHYTGQNVYFNVRGFGNGGPGRVAIAASIPDTVYSDYSVPVTPGVWHLCEIHIVAGVHGRIEAKLDGRLLNLTYEAGRPGNINDLNTGNDIGYIKMDTTYNMYSYPSSLGLTMKTWFDSIAVGTANWIGGN